MAGTTHSNTTNPVIRGSFIVQKLMCNKIPLAHRRHPGEGEAAGPVFGADGARAVHQHSTQPVCASCHSRWIRSGFTLENYDAVGLWRTQENDVKIDATGELPTRARRMANGDGARAKAGGDARRAELLRDALARIRLRQTLGSADACATAAVRSPSRSLATT